MALDTYDNLKTEIAEWLNRQDLTAKIPTFIRLLEAQVERELRVREMQVLDETFEISTGTTALPSDFRGMHEVYVETSNGPVSLEYAALGELVRARRDRTDSTSTPRLYTVHGSDLLVAPLPNDTYDAVLSYYSSIPALATGNQSNWLLDRHPDLYLYGSLMQAAPYLKDDERIAVWGAAVAGITEQIRVMDEREVRGSTPLRARFKPYGGWRR